MAEYSAPLRDMKFVIKELAPFDAIASLPGCEEVTPDLVDAVLEEAGKFATGALSPLNWTGDQTGCKLNDGVVTTAPGFKQAYEQFVASGWGSLGGSPAWGGQG
jgi:acyl-CoA dehydrogenase